MPSYKVKSQIRRGEEKDGTIERKVYYPGDTVELDEHEAYSIRHALEDPPKRPSREPEVVMRARARRTDSGDDLENVPGAEPPSQEEEDALESIRKRPDNPDSGVMLHWQTNAETANRPLRTGAAADKTLSVGHGFERAHAEPEQPLNVSMGQPFGGLAHYGPPRPLENVTEMEKEDAKAISEAEEKTANRPGAAPRPPASQLPAQPAPPARPATPAPAPPAAPKK